MTTDFRNVANLGTAITVFASAARTTSPNPQEFDGLGSLTTPNSARVAQATTYAGIVVVIDVTAFAATPSVVFTIEGVDRLSGQAYTILASAAVTGTGTTVLRVRPGLTPAANTIASDALPPVFRIKAVHGDADSITYSVAALMTY